jgi:hypothetical protein
MTYAEFDRDVAKSIELYDGIIETNNPNLMSFYESGGKMLGYDGMVSETQHLGIHVANSL